VSAEGGVASRLELAELEPDGGKRGAVKLVGGIASSRGIDAHDPGQLVVVQYGKQQMIGAATCCNSQPPIQGLRVSMLVPPAAAIGQTRWGRSPP
jgi:hypothetical protein